MPSQPPINAFIFDLGRVIVDWDPRYLLQEIEPDPEKLRYLVEVVLDLEWFRAVDAGYPLSKAISERAVLYPDYAHALQVYVDRWPETIQGLFEGTVDIVRELRADRHPLYILSNWADETWVRVEKGFAFLEYFDDLIISGKVGMAKPDAAIFELAETQFAVDPAATLFIDDGQKNVDAAIAAGFQSILFETPEKLRADLAAMKVLKP